MVEPTTSTRADVLVVEDAATNLRLLAHMLRNAGYRVRVARDARSALRSAMIRSPDLVLMDINLPDVDGFETIAQMRASGALGDAPVIFISGRAETAAKVRAFETGGADYVTKPFNTAEVLARVEHQLQIQTLQRRLRRQRDELRRSEAAREALVEMVVHDMRAPLMAISAAIDLEVLDAASGKPSPALASARRSIRYLVELVTAMLDVSRTGETGLGAELDDHDLFEIVTEALDPFRGTDQTARIVVAAPGSDYRVICDRLLTRRMLANLLENALRASSGAVEVTLTMCDDRVEARVLDQGPGIPEDQRQAIFERFVRLPTAGGAHRTGLGIGLAFCYLAASAQHGRIGVDDGPSGGASFWFDLPSARGGRDSQQL